MPFFPEMKSSKPITFFIIAITITVLLFNSPPPKSTYHSLYVSVSVSDNATVSRDLYILTRRLHVAGSQANADAAAYVLATFASYALQAHITSYNVSLPNPLSSSLTLTKAQHPLGPTTTFSLQQEIHTVNPYADEVLLPFHAYAKTGSAAGYVAYVNYGRVEDYDTLAEMGVNVSGAVVLARYGKIFRGDILRNAYVAGAVGAVVYTDTKDYGGGPGSKWFPDDRWMPPSGVQVGTVYTGAGDPTTPGWASTSTCERVGWDEIEKGGTVPLIPSLPVSSADGEEILKAVQGRLAPDDWQGGAESTVYRLGPGPAFLNLTYNANQTITTIQNVFAVIEGVEEPDRYVLLGNHRDAWTFGAVDPNSGTAALLEVARRLGKLQKRGWKPRRTIVLCNWDAEEFGLIGSTEWVEENREMLASKVVAYLNVDSAVAGAGFQVASTPQLDILIKQATQQVQDPDNSSQTIYASWTKTSDSPKIGRLGGGGSDFAAFVQHVGLPAVDMSFGEGYPVYHSMYDNYVWMQKFGDPMFHRHVAMASIWGLVALKLADEKFLPFDYVSYASEFQKSTKDLENDLVGKPITLSPLYKAIEELKEAAIKINDQRNALEGNGWASMWGKDPLKVRELNDRLMMAERAFTDRDGLLERPWYKHLIYAPSKNDDYGSKSFPGIDDAIENARSLNTEESWKSVQHEVWRVSRVVTQASLVLNGKFT